MSQTARRRAQLLRAFPPCCHYCRVPIEGQAATLDHIWPVSLGGRRNVENLVLACGPCNTGFGDSIDKCDCDWCVRATHWGWRRWRKAQRLQALSALPVDRSASPMPRRAGFGQAGFA